MEKISRLWERNPYIGGLEVTDAFLRLVLMTKKGTKTASLRLSPGIVEDGYIRDNNTFLAALKNLHAQIATEDEVINVVLTLSTARVYSQIFSLPPLESREQESARLLNLEMISPINIGDVYYDSEFVGTGATLESEFLGAFAPKILVDELTSAMMAQKFRVVAVEFAGLSIARMIKILGVGYDFSKAYLAINFFSDGVDFMILKNGNLYFHYFSSWEGVLAFEDKRQIEFGLFAAYIRREIQKVVNFAAGKWGNILKEAILISREIPVEIKNLIEKEFGIATAPLSLKNFSDFAPQWSAALGAALRGSLPRSDDVFISLAAVGTEEEYTREKLRHFLSFWRNMFAAAAVLIFAVFLIEDVVLAKISADMRGELKPQISSEDASTLNILRERALSFNRKLNLALYAKKQGKDLSELLNNLKRIAANGVVLEHFYVQAQEGKVRVSGLADSEFSAITFKNNLSRQAEYQNLSLPFANINTSADGKVHFELTFEVKI